MELSRPVPLLLLLLLLFLCTCSMVCLHSVEGRADPAASSSSAFFSNIIVAQDSRTSSGAEAAAAAAAAAAGGGGGSNAGAGGSCQPLMFVFGASMWDTGEFSSAMPFSTRADFVPYGVDYFSRPAGRWSNGRVITDFISQGLGYGLLNPYLRSVAANFTFGANFASAGSTARDSDELFPLSVQVNQFIDFLNELNQSSEGYSSQQLNEAIFFFENGNNDYVYQFENTTDFDVPTFVTSVLDAMEDGFRELYNLGARNFVVMGLTPLGCTPVYIVRYPNLEADEYGCRILLNYIMEFHNEQLQVLLTNLSSEFSDANWVYFDAYGILIDGYHNPSNYGVLYPFSACCGAGGVHNFVDEIQCGSSRYINGTFVEATACSDPSQYIIWDSIHFVESFARYIAKGILTSSHLRPTFDITSTCFSVA